MATVEVVHRPTPSLTDLGQAIPDTAHAVSVSLPSWKANIGYEEGEEWVLSKMKTGYPRFFVHLSIQAFAKALVEKFGDRDEKALLFPSSHIATQCVDFIVNQVSQAETNKCSLESAAAKFVRTLDLILRNPKDESGKPETPTVALSTVIVPQSLYSVATKFWQHSGDGVSSRRAEFFHQAFNEGYLVPRQHLESNGDPVTKSVLKGPKRYQKGEFVDAEAHKPVYAGPSESDGSHQSVEHEFLQFVEERFGRNLDMSLAISAKLAIRRRIAGTLTADTTLAENPQASEALYAGRHGQTPRTEDVYLWPTGMSAIYNTHRMLLGTRGILRSIMFGFPYIDTLKVLEKFGPGALFYGHGSAEELDDLEQRCGRGQRFLALFCEFPGNPLLKTPDIDRIRNLADRFEFAVVVDETIGNFLNVNVLPQADVVVSSLTKVFSGDSNVMGGSSVLNPMGAYYRQLRSWLANNYRDHYWPEDAVFMERNSRDFITRNSRINANAEAVCSLLRSSRYIKEVYYPKYSPTKLCYERHKTSTGGFGGLLSATFYSTMDAISFFDSLDTAKGPSLGTNFTLSSPFVILAHYHELEWAGQYGAETDLVRISVGLEDPTELCHTFQRALIALEKAHTSLESC